MKKKILSLLLVASTLLAVLPMFAVGTVAVAAEDTASAGKYDQYYVQDGLVSMMNLYDLTATSDLTLIQDSNGTLLGTGAYGDGTTSINAVEGGLYIGANTFASLANVIPATTEEGAAYTYQFVFELADAPLANKTPATESQFSWDGAYAARPAFVAGPLSILAEPISKEAAAEILAGNSAYMPTHGFVGGIAKSYVQLFDTWHSDYDRTNIMPTLMNFEYGVPSALTFSGETTKVVKTHVGKGEGGSDLVITTYGASINSILRNTTAVPVNPDRLVTNNNYSGISSDIRIGSDLPMVLYSVRAYDRELTVAEINQNHFADLAAFNELDLFYFNYLSDHGKQLVYSAFANKELSSLSASDAQDFLDKTVEAIPAAHRYDYNDLIVEKDLVGMLSFDTVSSNDICEETEFTDGDLLLGEFIRYGDKAPDACTWTYGDGYLNTGLNGTLDMSGLLNGLDTFTVQTVMAHNTLVEEERFSSSVRTAVDPTQNATRAVSVLHAGIARLSYRFSEKSVDKGGVKNSILHAWNGSTYGVTAISGMDADGDASTTVINRALNLPFDFTLTQSTNDSKVAFALYNKTAQVATAEVDALAEGTKAPLKSLTYAAASNLNLYCVRVYSRVLNDAELKQNHFADLARQLRISLSLFNLMNDEQKATIYDFYANTELSDTTVTKESVETKIASVFMASDLQPMAEQLVAFKGFQMATTDEVAFRPLFALDNNFLAFAESGATVSVGIVSAPASATDLTVTIDASGAVKANDATATVTPVYANKAFTSAVTYNGTSITRFALPVSAADYNAEYKFCAYVALTMNGTTTIAYCDTISPLFGDSVNATELATFFYTKGYTTGGIKAVYDAANAQ